MKSLDRYAKHFDKAYPRYHDGRYGEVLKLVEAYDAAGVEAYLRGPDLAKAASLIEPLTAIKNYKSQVPYPRDAVSAISRIVELRGTAVTTKDVLSGHVHAMARLLDIEGFQLPTVSAILHFCHPRHFPIVDVNVQAACALLRKRHPSDFETVRLPKLPGPQTSPGNQIEKYRCFIRFIDRIVELQKRTNCPHDYRYLDKALMVLGVPRWRKQAERVGRRAAKRA